MPFAVFDTLEGNDVADEQSGSGVERALMIPVDTAKLSPDGANPVRMRWPVEPQCKAVKLGRLLAPTIGDATRDAGLGAPVAPLGPIGSALPSSRWGQGVAASSEMSNALRSVVGGWHADHELVNADHSLAC